MPMAAGADNKILAKLGKMARQSGGLPPFLQFYRELFEIQSEAKSRISVNKPDFAGGVAADRLGQGIPLLSFADFAPDWGEVQSLFEKVAAWMGKDAKTPPGESERLRKISRDPRMVKVIAEAWYSGNSPGDVAAAENLDSELLTSVAAAVLKPFLAAYAILLLPEVEQAVWRRRYCPVCGGSPDFAYLDRDNGARWLVCSRCDADWLFLRLECPYCGTQNQEDLAYFTEEGEIGFYRLYVCKKCRTYLKAVDLRRAGAEILLPLEHVLTVDLDRQAQEKGYRPGQNNPRVAVG